MSEHHFQKQVIDAIGREMPSILRWGGTLAKCLRRYQIALEGKTSGSRETDALTLADLSVQELVVSALRDRDPVFQKCRLQAEEETGDLERFAKDSPLTMALDPIDGTKMFRDHTGDGYAVMLHVRTEINVICSLVYLPEMGAQGTWVHVARGEVRCGPDDQEHPAEEIVRRLQPIRAEERSRSKRIYLIGFQQHNHARAEDVTRAGLEGFAPDEMPGSIYPLLARGEFGGSLIHTPNIYDFPVSLHIARTFGGNAVWVHDGQSVHFRDTWLDDRADMLRLPGIVACAVDPEILETLVSLARDWDQRRYADE